MTGDRVLVTGASGFIGHGTVDPLLACGWDVHAISRAANGSGPGAVTWHRIDLHDQAAVDGFVRDLRPSRLLHLAWNVSPGSYTTSLENLQWVQSTLTLVRAFAAAGGQRLVCAGTSAEYDWRQGCCVEATTPLQPASLYAASKAGLFHIIERLSAQIGLSFAWGRVFFMYGPNEAPQRLVPAMIQAATRRQPLALRYPRQVRDYLHVGDVAAAFVALLRSDVQGAVNIGSGKGIALAELGATVARHAGHPVVLAAADPPPPDPFPVVVADITKLRDHLGWSPLYELDHGVAATVAWWKAQESAERA